MYSLTLKCVLTGYFLCLCATEMTLAKTNYDIADPDYCSGQYVHEATKMCVTGFSSNLVTKIAKMKEICSVVDRFAGCMNDIRRSLAACSIKLMPVTTEYFLLRNNMALVQQIMCQNNRFLNRIAERGIDQKTSSVVFKCLRESIEWNISTHKQLCGHIRKSLKCWQSLPSLNKPIKLPDDDVISVTHGQVQANVTRLKDLASCYHEEMSQIDFLRYGLTLCNQLLRRNQDLYCKLSHGNLWTWFTTCVTGGRLDLAHVFASCRPRLNVLCSKSKSITRGMEKIISQRCIYTKFMKRLQDSGFLYAT